MPIWERAGLRTLLLDEPENLEGVLDLVTLLGNVTGQVAGARLLRESMREEIDQVVEQITAVETGPRVYHELDPTLYSVASKSFVGDLYLLLKAQNIASGEAMPFPQLTAEAIIAANPEVIILADGEFPGGTPEEVRSRPGWDAIGAVQNNRVYAVDPDILVRPGPRIVEGLASLAAVLYPDLFQ